MEITLESVNKNKKIYIGNGDRIKQQRTVLMEQVKELRKNRESMINTIDIAKLDFEESKLIQQITELNNSFKSNKLTLEQLDAQEAMLTQKISKETYADIMGVNRKARQDLSKQEEIEYDENEINKYEKAIKLYTLMGDTKSVEMWNKKLEKAQKDLALAQHDLDKDPKTQVVKDDNQEQQTTAPYVNEYGEIVRPDNAQRIVATDEGYIAGYTVTEQDGVFVEETNQSLNNYLGQQMGERTIVEIEDIKNGTRSVETKGHMENEDGKYTMYEKSEGVGGELTQLQKKMIIDNKITGQKEELTYQKDSKVEMYSRKANGQITFKITKTDKGVSIDEYRNGQPYSTYEYDENGKAVIGMDGLDEIDDEYVANFFDSQVPYFEAKGLDKTEQSKKVESSDILESAVKATEKVTATSTISEQEQIITSIQRDRNNTRQPYKESPEKKTRANDNPESFRETLRFNVSSEMKQEISNENQDTERDFTEGRMGKVEKHKTEDTEHGVR